MAPRRTSQAGKVVPLSASQQAVIYGRGTLILIRHGEAWHLNDAEAKVLEGLVREFHAQPAETLPS